MKTLCIEIEDILEKMKNSFKKERYALFCNDLILNRCKFSLNWSLNTFPTTFCNQYY